MRKLCLTIILLIGFSKALLAQFGNCTASEMQTYTDHETGNTITILTDTLKNDRFLYQTDPMWTSDGKYLLFRSSSRGNGEKIERTLPNGEKRSCANVCAKSPSAVWTTASGCRTPCSSVCWMPRSMPFSRRS